MQNGSLICRQRQGGPSAWEFRWREPGSDGKRRHRRIVLGSTLEFVDECAARQAIVALQLEIIGNDVRTLGTTITLAAAYSHFRQQELRTESAWSTFSTRNGYEGYLKKWVIPRWGTRTLPSIWRSSTVDAIVAIGTFNLRQDQKRHERLVQPHNPPWHWQLDGAEVMRRCLLVCA